MLLKTNTEHIELIIIQVQTSIVNITLQIPKRTKLQAVHENMSCGMIVDEGEMMREGKQRGKGYGEGEEDKKAAQRTGLLSVCLYA